MRVVLADDHRVVREGLRYMLEGEPGVEIVGEVASGEELLELLESALEVDVVLLDVRMPGMGGLEALEEVLDRCPDVRVLMLSMHDQPAYVRRAMEAGASGYLLKSTGREELVRAIEAVSEGAIYVQGELMRPLVTAMDRPGTVGKRALSPREREVLELVAAGRENKQIAAELGIAEATVKAYLRGIFEFLEVSSRAEAVAVALREGLIE